MMRCEVERLPPNVMQLMNLVTRALLNKGSGMTSRLGTVPRRGILLSSSKKTTDGVSEAEPATWLRERRLRPYDRPNRGSEPSLRARRPDFPDHVCQRTRWTLLEPP